MLPILPPLLASTLSALPAPQAVKPQPPVLRLQKSLRLPVKARPSPAQAKPRQEPGAVVEVRGEGRALETEREQVLREFGAWLVANRFRGSGFNPALQPVRLVTSWESTHPGGFTVAPLAPLGWGY
jgi:hypothetical protein